MAHPAETLWHRALNIRSAYTRLSMARSEAVAAEINVNEMEREYAQDTPALFEKITALELDKRLIRRLHDKKVFYVYELVYTFVDNPLPPGFGTATRRQIYDALRKRGILE